MQAAQVRKVCFVPDDTLDYQPDRHSSSTIYAGTTVQQVSQYTRSLSQTFQDCHAYETQNTMCMLLAHRQAVGITQSIVSQSRNNATKVQDCMSLLDLN